MLNIPTTSEATHYFTFYDMDDTSIRSSDDIIKNCHLLLPIMLFQSHAAHQHLGILTNRPSKETVLYTVKRYVEDLKSYGIYIPEDHVVYGGYPVSEDNYTQHKYIEQAIRLLRMELEQLNFVDSNNEAKENLESVYDYITNNGYKGKNALIKQFLNGHLSVERGEYTFATGSCSPHTLTVGLVDDLEDISSCVHYLGKHFFGIKAARGGKLSNNPEENEDYFSDTYLLELATKIGLNDYALSLLKNPKQHALDPAMQKVAALLYAWHAFPGIVTSESFINIQRELIAEEVEQILRMLEYIKKHANTSKEAHYNPVNNLVTLFKLLSDSMFLKTAPKSIVAIRKQKKTEESIIAFKESTSDSNINLTKNDTFKKKEKSKDKDKSSALFGKFKRSSKSDKKIVPHENSEINKTNNNTPINNAYAVNLSPLEIQESLITNRLLDLVASEVPQISSKAQDYLCKLREPESSSTFSISSGSIDFLTVIPQKTFTPSHNTQVENTNQATRTASEVKTQKTLVRGRSRSLNGSF